LFDDFSFLFQEAVSSSASHAEKDKQQNIIGAIRLNVPNQTPDSA
jgi:hypothetical protein